MNSPRDSVIQALRFESPPRIPRDLWALPWAESHHPDTLRQLRSRFPSDFVTCPYLYPPSPRVKGDPYSAGRYTDEWGCTFESLQAGLIGEVKTPLLADVLEWETVRPPYEQLPRAASVRQAYEEINRFYRSESRFVMANICPRPWERYQFIRGSENAYSDLALQGPGVRELLACIHAFYKKEVAFWAESQVDAIMFMDDWGAQSSLLISPSLWREWFKPLYREYCETAHTHGKFAFMHSDGYILDIYEDLAEIGVDAVNSQLFCMDIAEIAHRAKGKITFWGEIDRQHVLPSLNPDEGRKAVRRVAEHLYDPSGGIIAQFEFGAGANPDTAVAVFEEWERISMEGIGSGKS